MKNKNIAITFIFIFVLLLLGILGLSYAYFQPTLSSTGNENLVVSKDLRLIFNDESISEGEIYPGESYSKKFTVTNNGLNTLYYEIKWQDYNNSFTNDEIHIELKCVSYTNYFNGSASVSGTCEGFSDKAVTADSLKEAIEITSGKTHEYEVILTFIETGTNQDYNKGKIFNSTLDVVENVLLTVNINGGTLGQTLKTAYEIGEVVALLNPIKSGNVFLGWTASGRGTSLNGSNLTIGDANATLTAGFLSYNDMFTYYIGATPGVSGTDYSVIDDLNGNWRIKFLTSGTFTPLVGMTIDAFLLGGGTGGNVGGTGTATNSGGGGGGGKTLTVSSISLTANQAYPIVIGNGGGSSGAGQSSTGFGETATTGTVNASKYKGNAGGSGGGGGAQGYTSGGIGGTNGGNGAAGYWAAGSGQGTTTREFGEGTGTLYAGGGGGGGGPYSTSPQGAAGGAGGGATGGARQGGKGSNAAANTGGGGGGGGAKDGAAGGAGGTGGSGIVVIRNHR